MKQGVTLDALVQEVAYTKAHSEDLLADTRKLAMFDGERLALVGRKEEIGIRDYAHGQIAEFVGMPLPFYRRLKDSYADALDYTVNRILHTEPKTRLVRTIDGEARAFLSDRYRVRDNYDLIQAVVPTLNDVLGHESLRANVVSCGITETRLFLTVVFPMFEDELRPGDPDSRVKIGVRISNSEVGAGRTKVETILWTLVCLNGQTTTETLRANHVGRKNEVEEGDDFTVYSDATLKLDDRAFFAKVTDSVRAAGTEARFEKIVRQMRALATGEPVETAPAEAIKVIGQSLSLTQEEQESVLTHLIDGGDRTPWGYVSAVTRAAQDVESYDRSMEMEALGGKLAADFSRKYENAALTL